MADEFSFPPSHVLTEIFHLSHHQDFFVCNYFLPAYLALEDVDFVDLHQDWLYECLIWPDFGSSTDAVATPNLFQSQEYSPCFDYSVVDVFSVSALFEN